MKVHQFSFQRNLLLACFSSALIFSCKKDYTPATDAALQAKTSSSALVTDNVITVQTDISAPVTPQTFIANGQSSIAAYQINAAQAVMLEQGYFSGTYPAIQYITSPDIGVAVSHNGNMGLIGLGIMNAGSGINLPLEVHYATVDSSTSGTVAQLSFSGVNYKTNDGIYHNFVPKAILRAQSMCLVNNIAHISLSNPSNATPIDRNYHQIATVELTGDTGWVLNSLPLMLSAPLMAKIPSSQLIIKSKEENIIIKSDTVKLGLNSRAQTVIKFPGGFRHVAGEKETLIVYAKTPTIGQGQNPIVTTIYPLNAFVWTDGLGAKIPGNKNVRFYKEQTGTAEFYQQ